MKAKRPSTHTTNPEIRNLILKIYDKLNSPSTRDVGYDMFIKLIEKNISSKTVISQILFQIGEFLKNLQTDDKDPYIKLIALVYYQPIENEERKEIYYPFLQQSLSILQNLIKDSNSNCFISIANCYSEIVGNTMPIDIGASTRVLLEQQKKAYEMIQSFSLFNMKSEDKANQIVGSLCITKLIENCPIILQEKYMNYIFESIMECLSRKTYNAKTELLTCMISLILGAETQFSQYASKTLFKIIDFLTDSDWHNRKLSLNVIYSLIIYCSDIIIPLKDRLIEFLRKLKTDKYKEVREVCLLILNKMNEFEPKSTITERNSRKLLNNSSMKKKPREIQKKLNKIKEKDNLYSSMKIKTQELITRENNRSEPDIEDSENKRNMSPNNINRYKNFDNRKGSSIINSKMIIKTDPKKSIFQQIKNENFF